MFRIHPWLVAALLACAVGSAHAAVELVDPWIRDAPPRHPMRAGFVEVRNTGSSEVRIVGASSTAFGAVSLHETLEAAGSARMREVSEVVVPAGGSVKLEPGGKHLMLIDPNRALDPGTKIPVQLQLSDGTTASAEFEVRAKKLVPYKPPARTVPNLIQPDRPR